MIGTPVLDYLPREEAARIQLFAEENRTGRSVRFPVNILHRNGQTILVMVSAAPLFTDEGVYDGALVMLMDVTELKQPDTKHG